MKYVVIYKRFPRNLVELPDGAMILDVENVINLGEGEIGIQYLAPLKACYECGGTGLLEGPCDCLVPAGIEHHLIKCKSCNGTGVY